MIISVVMAVYNGKLYFRKQMQSILEQELMVDEVIIVDDCSTEKVCSEINEFRARFPRTKIKYFEHKDNKGYAQTFFEALKHASGDIIFLSDQDDIWLPNKTNQMTDVLAANKNISCLSSRNIIIDKDGIVVKWEPELSKDLEKVELVDLITQTKIRPGMSLAITKELRDKIISYDIEKFVMHDRFIELAACIEDGFYLVNEFLTKYRIHGENTSGMNLTKTKLRSNRVGRIKQIDKELSYFSTVFESGLNITPELEKIIKKQSEFYVYRKEMLKTGFIRYLVRSIRIANCYHNKNIWLGDCLSLLLEKRIV